MLGNDKEKQRKEFTNGHKFFTPMEYKAMVLYLPLFIIFEL